MKKYLQFCLMSLLVLGMGLSMGSCKDENEGSGSPNPLLGVQVDLSEIDSTAIALVDIDQANKLITISLSKTVTNLSAVPVTFDLVNGAYLYTPYVTNPVLMDLTEETGVNIATGDNIVCYKLVAEEDQALKSLKATANGIDAITNVDYANKLIDICFEDNEVDLSAINLEFELSPVSTMVSPSTPTATVDLSADTSIIKVYNEFKGEVEYKVICWNYPTGGVMDVKEYSDESIYKAYSTNNISQAIVIGGLEPMLQLEELINLIKTFRGNGCDDPIIIYTGFNKTEILYQVEQLKMFKNIIIKFGRYVENSNPIYDEVLGVTLASDNQYAEKIS